MNYPQIISPVPFASKSGGSCPPAPMGAPPMINDDDDRPNDDEIAYFSVR